jgi:hypothetical protein
VSWQVTGVRQDAWANTNRIVPVVEKNEREKGKYLNPEVFGKDQSFAIHPNVVQSSNTMSEKERKTLAENSEKAKSLGQRMKKDREALENKKQMDIQNQKGKDPLHK